MLSDDKKLIMSNIEFYGYISAEMVQKAMLNLASRPITPEKHVMFCLEVMGLKLSVRRFGRLLRTYNNTGINLPIGQLVREIAEGKRNDFYDNAERLNKLI